MTITELYACWLAVSCFFKCNKTKDNGKRYWDRVIEKMPIGLANGYVMTDEEKVFFFNYL